MIHQYDDENDFYLEEIFNKIARLYTDMMKKMIFIYVASPLPKPKQMINN